MVNNNLYEQDLSIKKQHLNKKGNTVFAYEILKLLNNWLANLERSFDLHGATSFY